MTKKVLNALFVGLILVLLLAGLGRTVFLPKQINTYENRYAEKLAPLPHAAACFAPTQFYKKAAVCLCPSSLFVQAAWRPAR